MAKKILLVDDDEDLLQTTKFFLEHRKYDVILARNGVEAIKMAKQKNPDVILLDIMMPVMDGFAACRKLKKGKATKKIPIVMLTVKGARVDVLLAMSAHADAYFVKPVNLDEVLERINELLKAAS